MTKRQVPKRGAPGPQTPHGLGNPFKQGMMSPALADYIISSVISSAQSRRTPFGVSPKPRDVGRVVQSYIDGVFRRVTKSYIGVSRREGSYR